MRTPLAGVGVMFGAACIFYAGGAFALGVTIGLVLLLACGVRYVLISQQEAKLRAIRVSLGLVENDETIDANYLASKVPMQGTLEEKLDALHTKLSTPGRVAGSRSQSPTPTQRRAASRTRPNSTAPRPRWRPSRPWRR